MLIEHVVHATWTVQSSDGPGVAIQGEAWIWDVILTKALNMPACTLGTDKRGTHFCCSVVQGRTPLPRGLSRCQIVLCPCSMACSSASVHSRARRCVAGYYRAMPGSWGLDSAEATSAHAVIRAAGARATRRVAVAQAVVSIVWLKQFGGQLGHRQSFRLWHQ